MFRYQRQEGTFLCQYFLCVFSCVVILLCYLGLSVSFLQSCDRLVSCMLSRFIFAPTAFCCILLLYHIYFQISIAFLSSFTLFFQFLWPNILAAVSRSMSEHIFKAQLQEPHIIYYSTAYDLISWDVTVSEDASSCHASLQMESMRFHYKGLLSSSAYDSQYGCSKLGKYIKRRSKIFAFKPQNFGDIQLDKRKLVVLLQWKTQSSELAAQCKTSEFFGYIDILE